MTDIIQTYKSEFIEEIIMAEINNAHPITVIPYLSFLGNCEEALNTYIEAFGGEIYYLSRWSEKTFDVTPEQIGKVMHAEYALGNTRMAAGVLLIARI